MGHQSLGLELRSGDKVVLWRSMDSSVLTIGRNAECDLCVPDEPIGPVHGVMSWDGEALYIKPHASAQVVVNGDEVHEPMRLADGDILSLGSLDGVVRFVGNEPVASSQTRTLMHQVSRDRRDWVLRIPELDPHRSYTIDARGVTLGAEDSNDVVLTDPYVSRMHARFFIRDGHVVVEDLGSRNGVFIGAQKISSGEVPNGSQVKVGQTLVYVTERAEESSAEGGLSQMLGASKEVERVRQLIARVGSSEVPVLLTGETGTGKEVAARMVAESGVRKDKPFIAINCGALTRDLVESELFGHEKGAFTGAAQQKAGAFEAANGGTLFLDEIGELPLDMQPKLLRALENSEVRRLGSPTSFQVDVRVIAATNRRLEEEVAAGRFREDLLHRINIVQIELPALRKRQGDVALLAKHFIETFSPPGESVALTQDAIERLEAHHWPGNIRELRNTLQRAVLMRLGDSVEGEDITFPASTLASRVEVSEAVSSKTLAEIECEAIRRELIRHKGNKKEAAKALGVSRSTIHRKIEEYQIEI